MTEEKNRKKLAIALRAFDKVLADKTKTGDEIRGYLKLVENRIQKLNN